MKSNGVYNVRKGIKKEQVFNSHPIKNSPNAPADKRKDQYASWEDTTDEADENPNKKSKTRVPITLNFD